MKKNNLKRLILYYGLAIILVIVVFFIALGVGRYTISPKDFFAILFGHKSDPMNESVIFSLRLPRTIIALLVGIALSLSGLVYQDVFQNKLISPDFLGVSTGAGFGASLAIIIGFTGALISTTAFIFGLLTMVLTVTIFKLLVKFKIKTEKNEIYIKNV